MQSKARKEGGKEPPSCENAKERSGTFGAVAHGFWHRLLPGTTHLSTTTTRTTTHSLVPQLPAQNKWGGKERGKTTAAEGATAPTVKITSWFFIFCVLTRRSRTFLALLFSAHPRTYIHWTPPLRPTHARLCSLSRPSLLSLFAFFGVLLWRCADRTLLFFAIFLRFSSLSLSSSLL